MKLGYFTGFYPKLSETFLAHELGVLSDLDKDVIILAVTKGKEKKQHPFVEKIKFPVRYLQPRLFWHYTPLTLYYLFWSFVHYPRGFVASFFYFVLKKKMLKKFLYAANLIHLLKKENIAHLHVHFNSPIKIGLIANSICKVDFSCTVHSQVVTEPYWFWQKVGERVLFIRTVGTHTQKLLLERMNKSDHEKVIVSPMGIDMAPFLKIQPSKTDRVLNILSIGRLVPKKGFVVLLEAAKILQDRDLSFQIHLIGGGPEESKLKLMTKKFNLPVIFYGALEQSSKFFSIFKKCNIFVLPCIVSASGFIDGLPIALVEAMAAGLPVISTRISNIPELVDKMCGLLAKPKDAQDLANKIQSLSSLSSRESKLMGQAGIKRVRDRYNVEKTARNFAKLIWG